MLFFILFQRLPGFRRVARRGLVDHCGTAWRTKRQRKGQRVNMALLQPLPMRTAQRLLQLVILPRKVANPLGVFGEFRGIKE